MRRNGLAREEIRKDLELELWGSDAAFEIDIELLTEHPTRTEPRTRVQPDEE